MTMRLHLRRGDFSIATYNTTQAQNLRPEIHPTYGNFMLVSSVFYADFWPKMITVTTDGVSVMVIVSFTGLFSAS